MCFVFSFLYRSVRGTNPTIYVVCFPFHFFLGFGLVVGFTLVLGFGLVVAVAFGFGLAFGLVFTVALGVAFALGFDAALGFAFGRFFLDSSRILRPYS